MWKSLYCVSNTCIMEQPLVTAIGIVAILDDHDDGMNISNDYFCEFLYEYYYDYKMIITVIIK